MYSLLNFTAVAGGLIFSHGARGSEERSMQEQQTGPKRGHHLAAKQCVAIFQISSLVDFHDQLFLSKENFQRSQSTFRRTHSNLRYLDLATI